MIRKEEGVEGNRELLRMEEEKLQKKKKSI
jgi:hypothetical protein